MFILLNSRSGGAQWHAVALMLAMNYKVFTMACKKTLYGLEFMNKLWPLINCRKGIHKPKP